MDQKFVNAGGALTAGLLFFCALLVTPLGFGMLFSYPDGIWPLGLLLLACAGTFIASGIANLKRTKRMQGQSDADIQAVQATLHQVRQNPPNAGAAAPAGVSILARWTYTDSEWNQFLRTERKRRKRSTSLVAATIFILGALFVRWQRGADWGFAFTLSGIMAAIYWLGRYLLSMASIGRSAGGANEVVILRSAIVINGRYNAIRSEMYGVTEVRLDEAPTPAVLEITYQWQTRKGNSYDEIRIPVPEDKLDEARRIVSSLW